MQLLLRFLAVVFLISNPIFLWAQAFNINTFFTEAQYAFYSSDSNNYIFDQVKTQLDVERRLDSLFKLPTGSFYNATQKISYSGNRKFISGLHNQVPAYDTIFKECEINYTYSGINGSTYSFYVPAISDTTIAFLIMPGSGISESFKIAEGNPYDYHNSFCKIKDLLRAKGDVYVYNRPNEEFRGIWINHNNTNNYRRLSYDVLDPYTKLNGRDWQDNLFSEFNVWIHFLKQKYKRVILLGLSAGGWPVVFSSQQINTDACIVAAGMSAATYQNFSVPNNLNTILDGVLGVYTLDSVRKNMRSSNTEYLFTYGNGDTGGNLYEYNTHALQDSLNKPSIAPNLNFSYFIGGHTYHCLSLDTFLNRVLNKPKPIVTVMDAGCNTDSIACQVELLGTPPFSFDLYKDSTFIATYSTSSKLFNLYINQNGNYQIRNLDDAGSGIGYKSDWFNIKLDPKPTATIISKVFVCDSNYTKIKVALDGTSPFQLSDSLNGIVTTRTINDSFFTYYIPNQQTLKILELSDNAGCNKSITQTFPINEAAVNATFLTPYFLCDSLKSTLSINLTGKAPWLIQYIKDGLFYSHSSNTSSTNLVLENGAYNFYAISDSNTCSKSLSTVINLNYKLLTATLTPPTFNCDSNKSLFSLSITGNPPYTIYYRKNGVPTTLTTSSSNHNLWVTNGNYVFDSIKDATCKRIINSSYSINYSPITITLGPSSTNCDSNKVNIPVLVSGNPPYTLRYQKDGTALTTTLNGNTNLLLANGTYLFQELEDAQGCIKQINQVRNLNHQVLGITITPPTYNCDSNKTLISLTLTGNPPYTIYYRKNGVPTTLTTSSSNHNLWVTNGNYVFDSIKDATCKRIINSSYSINYSPITITLGPSSTNCDSNKINIPVLVSGNPPYTLRYQKDGIALTTTLNGNTSLLLANGTYLFQELEDAQGCIKQINQVRNLNHQVLGFTITPPNYNCDSNKSLFSLSITGNPPYTIYYRKNGVPSTLTTSSSNHNLWVTNGNYVFDSIKDATCKKVIPSNNYFINTNPVNITISNPVYICDSNKTRLSFSCQGTPPFNLYYQMNGNSLSHATASSSFDLHFSNGNLLIEKILDANGCEKFINNNYNFSETPVSAVLSNPTYNCDSSLHVINVQCTGKAPWSILYSNGISTYTYTTSLNSSTLKLTNGNYNIQTVQDANGCAKQINQSFALNVNPTLISALNAGYDCDSNKLKLIVNLTNHGPWILQFQKIAPNNQSFSVIATNSSNTYFFEPGSYVLSSVKNQIGCTTFAGYNFSNNFTPLSITKLGSSIDCDSAKLKTTYQLNGDGPWNLIYQDLNSGLYSSINTSTPLLNLYTPTGGIKLSVLSDSKCSIPLSDTILNNYIPLSSQFLNQSPACDSGKTKLSFLTNGGMMPYNYSYSFNGTNLTLPSSSDSLHLLLPKGSLYMSSVSDALGCSYTINKQFTLDYSPFRYDSLSSYYNCSSDSSFIKYFCETSSPLTVNYTPKNGTTQQFTFLNENEQFVTNNTYYVHNIVDTFGCAVMVNDTVSLNNYPIQEQNVAKISNCINQDYKFVFQLTGTSPWQLNYIQDNTAQQMLISQSPAVIPASVGDYFFISVIDSNQCQDTIHQYHQLQPYLDTAFSITYSRAILSVSIPAVKYFWYKDSQIFDTTSVPKTAFIGNGSYYVSIIDSLGCEYTSQILNIENIEPILVYPNPSDGVYTITLNYKLSEPWSYTLFDMYGRKIKTETQIDNHHRLDIRTLANGKYLLYLKYNEDGFYTNKVIAIEKR